MCEWMANDDLEMPVTDPMTYLEACEYVDQATEAEGEQYAEWGMGATSLGYNAAEWAADYGGYRTAHDPTFRLAQQIILKRQRALVDCGFRVIYRFPALSRILATPEVPF